MRVLSGIQPTGRFHLGNYFGAIRQYLDLQDEDESYYFIANLHALTTIRDRQRLEQLTMDAAIDLLSLGLDPSRATLFVQSDVPEVSELNWLLTTQAPLELLENCDAFREKRDKGLPADAGLFNYPLLMAADILAYDATVVPVGEDQQQHIDVCRDIAQRFNHCYDAEVFVLPYAKTLEASATVAGTNGQKMSKSYDNTIEIFEPSQQMRKKIMRMTTEASPPTTPEGDHVYELYSLFVNAENREEMGARYRSGKISYSDVKETLVDAANDFLAEPRQRREELEAKPDSVREILGDGAAVARQKARQVLDRAQQAMGLRGHINLSDEIK